MDVAYVFRRQRQTNDLTFHEVLESIIDADDFQIIFCGLVGYGVDDSINTWGRSPTDQNSNSIDWRIDGHRSPSKYDLFENDCTQICCYSQYLHGLIRNTKRNRLAFIIIHNQIEVAACCVVVYVDQAQALTDRSACLDILADPVGDLIEKLPVERSPFVFQVNSHWID